MILIAITLIAAIAIAGFVFGLFGSFTSSATIAASPAICVQGTAPDVDCTLTYANTGTANGNVLGTGASLTIGGTKYIGYCAPAATAFPILVGTAASTPVNAGGSATGHCSFAATTITSGEAFVGSVATSNGGTIQFAGSV